MPPDTPQQAELTHFLRRLGEGEGEDSSLMHYVYTELRNIAEAYMSSQRGAASLQTTALVHDAYVKLFARPEAIEWNDRVHFFALTARVMRQILVDHARKRRRAQTSDTVLLERSFDGAG